MPRLVARLRRDHQHVGDARHAREIGMVVGAVLDLRREARAVVIVDRHAEGAGAPGDTPADPSHAENAEMLAEQLDPD